MSDHYYTDNPVSINEPFEYRTRIFGDEFTFYSDSGVFSKKGIDFGSRLLIETVVSDTLNISYANKILIDLGSGIGVIGICIVKILNMSRVSMYEVNKRAVSLCEKNIKKNSVKNAYVYEKDISQDSIKEKADICVTNPPIRAGKQTVFAFYEKAYEILNDKGIFYCVIQKKQGSESTKKKLGELFQKVEIIQRSGGYHIYKCIKRL